MLRRLSGLRRNRVLSSTDLGEVRARVSEILQPHELAPGSGGQSRRAHVDCVKLANVTLSALHFGDAVVKVEEADAFYLLFCTRGSARVVTRGHSIPIDARNAAVLTPGHGFTAFFPGTSEHFVVRVDPRAMHAHPGQDRGVGYPLTLDLLRPALRSWVRLVQMLVDDPGLLTAMSRDRSMAVHYEALLLRLLRMIEVPDPDGGQAGGARPAVVRRAERYMQANSGEPLMLPQIATSSGVPVRTLQRTFKQFRGLSPIEHLRNIRLDRARTLLGDGRTDQPIGPSRRFAASTTWAGSARPACSGSASGRPTGGGRPGRSWG